MRIIFDPSKDARNQTAHGISLADAQKIDWASAVSWLDKRYSYGEERMSALGLIADRIYYVAYVDRDDNRRIISLRKASRREVKQYVQQTC